jgi:hypothetical protein
LRPTPGRVSRASRSLGTAIDEVRLEKARHRDPAALDEHGREAARAQTLEQHAQIEHAVRRRHGDHLGLAETGPGRGRRPVGADDEQSFGGTVAEDAAARVEPAARVEHHARAA